MRPKFIGNCIVVLIFVRCRTFEGFEKQQLEVWRVFLKNEDAGKKRFLKKAKDGKKCSLILHN